MNTDQLIALSKEVIQESAETISALNPDPIPRYLVLRDVLGLDTSDSELVEAKQKLFTSRWVQLLQETQWEDGSWGRFHGEDYQLKQKIPTTEHGISLALSWGLDHTDTLLQKTMAYIEGHLDGKYQWRDKAEKHEDPDAWPIVTRFLSAANLALIDKHHPKLKVYHDTWVQIVMEAFKTGEYNRETEITATQKLMGIKYKTPGQYHKKYPLILLSSTQERLDEGLEQAILAYAYSYPNGIGYLYQSKISEMPSVDDRTFLYWLRTQMLLSRFPLWHRFIGQKISEILAQRNDEGLWSFAPNVAKRPHTYLPLSESWRKKANKGIDYTVSVLRLLAKFVDQADGLL